MIKLLTVGTFPKRPKFGLVDYGLVALCKRFQFSRYLQLFYIDKKRKYSNFVIIGIILTIEDQFQDRGNVPTCIYFKSTSMDQFLCKFVLTPVYASIICQCGVLWRQGEWGGYYYDNIISNPKGNGLHYDAWSRILCVATKVKDLKRLELPLTIPRKENE